MKLAQNHFKVSKTGYNKNIRNTFTGSVIEQEVRPMCGL